MNKKMGHPCDTNADLCSKTQLSLARGEPEFVDLHWTSYLMLVSGDEIQHGQVKQPSLRLNTGCVRVSYAAPMLAERVARRPGTAAGRVAPLRDSNNKGFKIRKGHQILSHG